MKTDRYTKVVLTLIAVLLGVLALERSPATNQAYGQQPSHGNFDHITFSGSMGGFWLMDMNTGDIYVYDTANKTVDHFSLSKPGAKLQR